MPLEESRVWSVPQLVVQSPKNVHCQECALLVVQSPETYSLSRVFPASGAEFGNILLVESVPCKWCRVRKHIPCRECSWLVVQSPETYSLSRVFQASCDVSRNIFLVMIVPG